MCFVGLVIQHFTNREPKFNVTKSEDKDLIVGMSIEIPSAFLISNNKNLGNYS